MKGAQNTNQTQHHQKKATLYLCVSKLRLNSVYIYSTENGTLFSLRGDDDKINFFEKSTNPSPKYYGLSI